MLSRLDWLASRSEIFSVVESVYDEFVQAMKDCGARVLTEEEAQKVIDLCIAPDANGKLMPNKKFVGKNANVILKAAGVDVDESVDLQLAVILTDSTDHPYVLCEQLMPIFPICKVKDWDAAMAAAIKAENGCLDRFSGSGNPTGQGSGLHLLRHERAHRRRHWHDGYWLWFSHHRCLHRRGLHYPQLLHQSAQVCYVPGRRISGLSPPIAPVIYW